MESSTPEPVAKQSNGSGIIFASMTVLYLLVCICLGAFIFISRQKIPGLREYFPTQTALPTTTPLPTATAIAHKPGSTDQIFKDDFSENTQAWKSKWASGKLTVADGHLSFETSGDTTGMTQCPSCRFAHENFYIEADFSTNKITNEGYGVVFNISNAYGSYEGSYYLFEINIAKGRYSLYKFKTENSSTTWMLRLSKKSSLVLAYPQTNKLAVAFNKDTIELYLNGAMVERYQDPGTGLTSGQFGFFMDGSGFQLNVDNLFSYGE